ncbi:killer cell lectin-like receptor subfamily F member 1 [Tiliqua scincoides]|uniref:killer cell lectin-like receptor subfamily F member 1 n=1 Tax=Tiliqua scincoides TaxID=71010 RepID=UPI003461AE12
MAEEIVYADINNFPSEPNSSRFLHPSQQLRLGSVGILILLTAVITLILQLESEKVKTRAYFGSYAETVKCNASSADFQSRLRNRLCNQQWGNSSVNSTCRLCPAHWHLHRDKCYWISTDVKSWNESLGDCSSRNSQLLVIEDEVEMDFIKKLAQSTQSYWIGLFRSLPKKKWTWITGSEFNRNHFQEPKDAEGMDCGIIKNKILSEKCNAVFKWVCQQGSVLL